MAKKKKAEGEMGCTASVGGRAITLDPLREFTVPLPVREVESTLPCGFRVEWAAGTNGDEKFQLSVGAGVGSRWATFEYQGKSYCFDVEDLIRVLIESVSK